MTGFAAKGVDNVEEKEDDEYSRNKFVSGLSEAIYFPNRFCDKPCGFFLSEINEILENNVHYPYVVVREIPSNFFNILYFSFFFFAFFWTNQFYDTARRVCRGNKKYVCRCPRFANSSVITQVDYVADRRTKPFQRVINTPYIIAYKIIIMCEQSFSKYSYNIFIAIYEFLFFPFTAENIRYRSRRPNIRNGGHGGKR